MNPLLSDDTLTELLHHAGHAYDVPADGPDRVLTAMGPRPVRRPVVRRRVLALAAAAVVVLVGAAVVRTEGAGPSSTSADARSSGTANGSPGAGPVTDSGPGKGFVPLPAVGSVGAPQVGAPGAPQVGAPGAPPVGVPEGATGVPGRAGRTATAPADSARIVQSGTIVLVAPDGKVSAVLSKVQQVVASARGYVSSSSSQEAGSKPSGTVTLRVPEASYASVVKQVREIGVQVISVNSNGMDVTATYADVQAQIGSLTASRNRFLVILGQAKTIGETLSVQQRVDDVQAQIDRLEGQRRVLADQSDLATLTVSVSEAGDGDLVVTQRSGLSKAWHDAVHGFTSGVEAIVARSGRVLVVLLFVGLLLLVGRFGWRLARRSAL